MTTTPMRFSDLRQGMKARVTQMTSTPEILRLMEMGLVVGTEFSVMKVAPFGDTIEIRLRGYSLCMRQCEADGIELELMSNASGA